jgi:hypothetical protein
MDTKHSADMPGVEFLVNDRGERRAVLIDLRKHGALWENLYDAYVDDTNSLVEVSVIRHRREAYR